MQILRRFREANGADLSSMRAILFPHSYVKDAGAIKILAPFEGLTICQPWFARMSVPPAELEEGSFVHILRPPVNLKPRGDFMALLSEYKLWIRQNYDKCYATSFNATQEMRPSEGTPWEVRQMIRPVKEDPSAILQERSLKWHLILHLDRELEENRAEAEEMLKKVRLKKSPLEEALGDSALLQGLFDDLPESEMSTFISGRHLRQVFEAWTGLFGEYLPSHGPLITFDRNVMDYAMEIFQDEVFQASSETEESIYRDLLLGQDHVTIKHLPGISGDGNAEIDPVLKSLSGKTIILLEARDWA